MTKQFEELVRERNSWRTIAGDLKGQLDKAIEENERLAEALQRWRDRSND